MVDGKKLRKEHCLMAGCDNEITKDTNFCRECREKGFRNANEEVKKFSKEWADAEIKKLMNSNFDLRSLKSMKIHGGINDVIIRWIMETWGLRKTLEQYRIEAFYELKKEMKS